MRFFSFFLLLLIPRLVLSQACTEATINTPNGTNTYNCTTLTVSGGGINRSGDGTSNPLIINVSGDVLISSNILLNGANGSTDAGSFSVGGQGGPDGSIGGGFDGAASEPGAVGAKTIADGDTSPQEVPCASGGGGAGFSGAGNSGSKCSTSTLPNNRGLQVTSAEFDFTLGSFRGGFGGGAGGLGTSASHVGAGGGGGGALHINATGTLTIQSGVTISARGGNGGDDTTDGGGGGAGSGGAVWLVASGGITNSGTIDVRGGTGGKNNATGAHGGNASSGLIRLESAGTITNSTGVYTASGSSSNLNSSISCGSIVPISNDQSRRNEFFTMAFGFLLIAMSSILIRKLKANTLLK